MRNVVLGGRDAGREGWGCWRSRASQPFWLRIRAAEVYAEAGSSSEVSSGGRLGWWGQRHPRSSSAKE